MSVSAFYSPHGGANDNLVDIVVSWDSNGSSAVDDTTIRGRGVTSVTRDSAGVFTVVFARDVRQILFMTATVEGLETEDTATARAYCADETASPLTVRVSCFDTDANATPDEMAAGRRVFLCLKAKITAAA